MRINHAATPPFRLIANLLQSGLNRAVFQTVRYALSSISDAAQDSKNRSRILYFSLIRIANAIQRRKKKAVFD